VPEDETSSMQQQQDATPPNDRGLPNKRSSLAAENRLLKAAMTARREGSARRAIRMIDELVSRYPASPLKEEARVERMRALLSAGETTAARSDARRYLSEYPTGFARQEAARILASSSP
jgi:outer membrane protein assembly factor BamD (BamD/ComL family)